MNLGLQLVLGGMIRQALSLPPPITEAMPEIFHGYTQVNGTSIQVTELKFQDSVEERLLAGTLEAPCTLMITAEAIATGVLRHTGKPVSAYRHVHFETTVTYANGDPIEYLGEIKKVHKFGDEEVVNPYTDTPGPEITALIRKDGDYRITTTAYLATSTGEVIRHVFSRDVTINPCGADFFYYAGSLGNNANDGKDPNGFAGPFDYVESTGVLTAVGAFTSYDHTAASTIGYDRENTNWIYISGELRRIAEKISNDAIRIDYAFKLGADATGLTSSNGPKGQYTGGNPQADNFAIMLLSGQTFDFATAPSTGSVDDWFYIGTYGGTTPAVTTSTTLPPDSRLISMQTSSSIANLPNNIFISNIRLPKTSQILKMFSGISFADNIIGQQVDICLDRMVDEGRGDWYIPSSADIHFNLWGAQCLANQRMITFERTMAAGTLGDESITFQTAFDPADFLALKPGSTYASIKIYSSPTEFEYHRMSLTTADNLTFPLLNNRGEFALKQNFPAGTTVTIHESRGNQQLIVSKRLAIVGTIIESQCDLEKFDHHFYPNNQIGSSHYGWVYARDGETTGFMFNHNADDIPAQDGISVHDCYCRHSEYFVDSSNGSNDPAVSTQTNMILYRNKGDETVRGGTMYPWTLKSFFAKKMEFYNTSSIRYDGIIGSAQNPVPDKTKLYNIANQTTDNYVAEECKGFGFGMYNQDQYITTEIYNCEVWSNATDAVMLSLDPSAVDYPSGAELYVANNKFHAPNLASGKPFVIDGVAKTLAEFEALIPGGGNSIAQPDWNDPANGDFSPVPTARLYLEPKADTDALISFDVGANVNTVYDGQGIRFKVITSDTVTINGGGIQFDSTNFARLKPASNGALNLRQSLAFTTNAEFLVNFSAQSTIWDGAEHLVDIPVVAGSNVNVIVDGVTFTNASVQWLAVDTRFQLSFLRGAGTYYIYNIEIYDIATNDTLFFVAVDSGLTTGTEAAKVGTGGVTYDVAALDWTETPS